MRTEHGFSESQQDFYTESNLHYRGIMKSIYIYMGQPEHSIINMQGAKKK